MSAVENALSPLTKRVALFRDVTSEYTTVGTEYLEGSYIRISEYVEITFPPIAEADRLRQLDAIVQAEDSTVKRLASIRAQRELLQGGVS